MEYPTLTEVILAESNTLYLWFHNLPPPETEIEERIINKLNIRIKAHESIVERGKHPLHPVGNLDK